MSDTKSYAQAVAKTSKKSSEEIAEKMVEDSTHRIPKKRKMTTNEEGENIAETLHLLEALEIGNFNVPRQMVQVRDDEVRNNAGGYVFRVDDLCRLRRFLILGTTGGTYYVSEKQLTIDNVDHLIEMINQGKGGLILREIVDISLAGRAPKQNPALFALALCARYQVKDRKTRMLEKKKAADDGEDTKFDEYIHKFQQAAFRAVPKVCRIPTHLFMFVKYCDIVAKATSDSEKPSSGWGRAMRKCIADWYLSRIPSDLVMHLTKYKNREGYTHKDLLRLSHPIASQNHAVNSVEERQQLTLLYDQIFNFACKGGIDADKSALAEDEETMLKRSRCDYLVTDEMVQKAKDSEAIKFLHATMEVSNLKTSPEEEEKCAEIIRKFGLVREHIPTALLNSAKVWIALLEKMPMTALIRNLSKLSSLGIIDGKMPENEKYVDLVVQRVTDADALHKARIHPITILLALSVYAQGRGLLGKLEWEVNTRVKEALGEAFQLAFKNVQPTGKRYCLALDVSGSMGSPISGGALSCREAAAAMSSVFLRTEEKVECMAFQDEFVPLPFTKDSSVTEMVEYCDDLDFGSTDCSLPMVWATETRKAFDVFVVFTDSETWAGDVHPFEALKNYRIKMEIPDAKLAVMGMTATEFTIADPTDPGMVDIVGLDSAIPELLRNFVLGEI